MKYEILQKLINVALGNQPADLVVQDCKVVNVYSEEITSKDLLISDGRFAALHEPGTGHGNEVVNANGKYAIPGLIDSHMHIESTLLSLKELARLVVPRGNTTIIADPHEIANVLGMAGIQVLLDSAADIPLRVLIQVPSRVPTAPGLETTGGVIGIEEIKEMLTWPETVSLGELDPSKVLPPLPEYIDRINATHAAGKIACGHAADLNIQELMAYACAGLIDDHECVTLQDVIERIRIGMKVNLREGTSERDLKTLIRSITHYHMPSRRMMHCTDDKQAIDIYREGHIDHNVRKAIEYGLPPIQSIQMATLNVAENFHIEGKIGGIAPGRTADLFLCRDLKELKADVVIFEGKIVARDGSLIQKLANKPLPSWALNTIHNNRPINNNDLRIETGFADAKVTAKVIRVMEESAIDEMVLMPMIVTNGEVQGDPERDILKIAVIDRHSNSGRVGKGLITGFGLKSGAIGSTVCHDNHNLIVVGSSDEEMSFCANTVLDMGGGFAVVHNHTITGKMPLRFGGIISEMNYEEVVQGMEHLNQLARELGISLVNPFMKLSILALPTVPELGLTDMGLIDVKTHSFTSLFYPNS